MGVSIRLIDFDSDRASIIDLLKRNRNLSKDYPYSERYDWMYLKNPHGSATGWIVIDEASNNAVGFTVALPREMSVSGKRVVAWNCADFSIDTKFRTLGIAAKLRRGARRAIDEGKYPFLYAHPNDRMLVIHQRVGHTPFSQMQRYAKLINVESKLESMKTKGGSIAKLVSPAANQVLDYVDKLRSTKHSYDIELHEDMKFTEDFTDFFNAVESNYKVWGVRDATYLNWRYHSNPIYRADVALARKNKKIIAYIIYTLNDRGALIRDIVTSEPDALPGLISELSRWLRKRPKCESISFIAEKSNPCLRQLTKLGFHPRPETSTTVVHAFVNFQFKSLVYEPSNWFMTVGDRDE